MKQDTRLSINLASWRVQISHAISADSGVWRCYVGRASSPPLSLIVTSEWAGKVLMMIVAQNSNVLGNQMGAAYMKRKQIRDL